MEGRQLRFSFLCTTNTTSAGPRAKATAGDRPRQQESTDEAPSAKKPRTLTRMFQASAAEQVGCEHAEAPVRVDDCGEDIGSDVATHSGGIAEDENTATTSTELFANDKDYTLKAKDPKQLLFL